MPVPTHIKAPGFTMEVDALRTCLPDISEVLSRDIVSSGAVMPNLIATPEEQQLIAKMLAQASPELPAVNASMFTVPVVVDVAVEAVVAAAVAVRPFIGRGDKLAIDSAASTAMRGVLNRYPGCLEVSIGEGRKDGADGLFVGQRFGRDLAAVPDYYLAVDPVDGTTQTSKAGREAASIIAVSKRPLPSTEENYLWRLCAASEIVELAPWLVDVDITRPDRWLQRLWEVVGRELRFAMLDRPRHLDLINSCWPHGPIQLLPDCDALQPVHLVPSYCTAHPFRSISDGGPAIDLILGRSGSTEAVIGAVLASILGDYSVLRGYDPAGGRIESPSGELHVAAAGILPGSIFTETPAGTTLVGVASTAFTDDNLENMGLVYRCVDDPPRS
jgi:fructose-1,6-bisphosphatase/sedoheptulose 1,7-bisphosphatase-like protein